MCVEVAYSYEEFKKLVDYIFYYKFENPPLGGGEGLVSMDYREWKFLYLNFFPLLALFAYFLFFLYLVKYLCGAVYCPAKQKLYTETIIRSFLRKNVKQ